MKLLRATLSVFLLLALIPGVAYPALVMVIAQVVFPHQANGSIVEHKGKRVGSELIGQDFFEKPGFFWGRPSATSPAPYTSFNKEANSGSTGSNYGPLNPALINPAIDPDK